MTPFLKKYIILPIIEVIHKMVKGLLLLIRLIIVVLE